MLARLLTAAAAVLGVFAALASSGYNQAVMGTPTLMPTKMRREIRNHRDPVPKNTVAICNPPLFAIRRPCGLNIIDMMVRHCLWLVFPTAVLRLRQCLSLRTSRGSTETGWSASGRSSPQLG